MKNIKILNIFSLGILIIVQSCVTKKKILYVQDGYAYLPVEISYTDNTIQVDDILDIRVGALIPEAAIPFNKNPLGVQQSNLSIDRMKLEGYLVSQNKTINFPILGTLSVADKTLIDLEKEIIKLLKDGGLLIDPTVTVRLINAKVTILGEVNRPGTYNFTENSISFLQALGLAGDLTINGNRDDVLILRTVDNVLTTNYVDLTSANWLNGPFERIKPNDIIIVKPNIEIDLFTLFLFKLFKDFLSMFKKLKIFMIYKG